MNAESKAVILNEVPLAGWLDDRGNFVPRVANISGGIEQAVPESWVPLYGVTRELLEAAKAVFVVSQYRRELATDGAAFTKLKNAIDEMEAMTARGTDGGAHG